MKFTETLKSSVTPEWKFHYMHYSKLRVIIESAQKEIPSDDDKIKFYQHLKTYQEQFFTVLEEELVKVENFFKLRIEEATRRFRELKRETGSLCFLIQENAPKLSPVHIINETPRQSPLQSPLFSHERSFIESSCLNLDLIRQNRKKKKHYINMFRTLKFATSEFYLFLNHIKCFQELNFTGFRKILKKFDKVFQTNIGMKYQTEKVEKSDFHLSKNVYDMVLTIEDIFIRIFSDGNRSKGMKKLRVPQVNKDKMRLEQSSFLVGIFFSSSSLLLFLTIFCLFFINLPPFKAGPVLILSSELTMILYLIGFSFNLYGWSRNNVNHTLIFEINPRDHLNYIECLWYGLFLLTLWFFFTLGYMFTPILHVPTYLFPFISTATFAFLLFVPFNILYRSSRLWLAKVIIKNLCTPYFPVTFADFWLFDQFCSMSSALSEICSLTPCLYIQSVAYVGENTCSHPSMAFNHIMRILPFYVRCAQCLRRFYDFYKVGSVDMAQLFNAIKYLSSIFTILFFIISESLISTPSNFMFWTSFLTRIISLCYLNFWDIWVDWSFFGSPDQLKAGKLGWNLRSNTVYPYRFIYYLAMIQNVIIRFSSLVPFLIARYCPSQNLSNATYTQICINVAEIFRRCIWNFFRLENEHLNNVGRYRIVRDVDTDVTKDYIFRAYNNSHGGDDKAPVMITRISQSQPNSPTIENTNTDEAPLLG